MSFDRTVAGIESIKQQGTISVDGLYDIIVCVLEDAYELGNVDGITELSILDEELYARKMNRIISALVSSYGERKDGLKSLRENLKERCETHNEAINSIQSELAVINTEIEAANENNKELEKNKNDLQIKRGHLLDAKAKNEELKNEIARLSDPNLDKLASENETLQGEVRSRKEKEDELKKKRDSINDEINTINNSISTLDSEISNLRKTKEEQETNEHETQERKKGLEIGIENIKKRIEELRTWISEFSSTQGVLNEEKTELQNKVNILVSVWNAFEKNEQGARVLSGDEYKEIPKWFEERIKQVNAILDEIQSKYQALVKESENLTK